MRPISEDHPLRLFFRGLVEDAFYAEVGLCDTELTDYVADLLVSFIHVDRIHALRDAQGRRLDQIALMLEEIADADAVATERRDARIHRHIGDVALFWSGVYPERLQHCSGLTFKDRLLDYTSQGKRSYAIAAELIDNKQPEAASLFGRLSQQFEFCCAGLGIVRKGLVDTESGGTSLPLVY